MRKVQFNKKEHYHIYNRGVDKRKFIMDEEDLERFLESMAEFNTALPIGSIYENSFVKKSQNAQLGSSASKLVNFVCYCINPNHYHFILEQLEENSISKFMHRLGTGYTNYFNKKYERSGTLFQGAFKAIHIDSNEYLLHLSAYINLNRRAHKLGSEASKSSWEEYIKNGLEESGKFCNKDIILKQFKNKENYREFAEASLEDIIARKDMEKLRME